MSYSHNSVLIYLVILTHYPNHVISSVIAEKSILLKGITNNTSPGYFNNYVNKTEVDYEKLRMGEETALIRVKRQKEDKKDKFINAVDLPLKKMARMVMYVLKKMWKASKYGGAHPLKNRISPPVYYLKKQTIGTFVPPDDELDVTNETKSGLTYKHLDDIAMDSIEVD